MLLINGIKLRPDESEDKLKILIEKKLRHPIRSFRIHKKSLDARKEPVYIYAVIVEIENEDRYLNKDISKYKEEDFSVPDIRPDKTVVIAGYGPSGIFAAYRLNEAGFKVIVLEKGKRITERVKDVERFFKEGVLDESSNIQFGEGGAGTFSDAKLTTRIKDKYIDYILNVFVENGAKDSIRYENHAHIGTDQIRNVISSITDRLILKGVEFHFNEDLKDICLDENRRLYAVKTAAGTYNCDYFLLGTGHSAYDVVKILKNNDVYLEKKDIAIGFRVEHPQSFIDQRQTKGIIDAANEYFLRYKGEKGVYSFCMCPGGIVVPAMSERNTIVTNGMSYSDRSSGIANSAILIQIYKEEFEDGYEYLHDIESKAYAYSSSYKALSQNISDFMNNELNPLKTDSTYPLGTVLYNFNDLFTKHDNQIIKDALRDFDRKIPGFIDKGIMIGPETRSSCPIRIKRDEHYQSINTPNLYPIGEGAGYGGGIMSCALDGIRVANEIIFNYGKV